jgi:2-octaprenyl-6-methoxyphenol hydroxylase
LNHDVDVLIAGGGLVGATLALALAGSRLRVVVVEPVPPEAPAQPSYDDRTTALAPSSQRVFAALGLWPELAGEAEPIREIHVSDRGRFGFVRMNAAEEHLEALGYVISNRRLGEVLPPRMAALENVELLCPASVESLAQEGEAVAVQLQVSGAPRTLRTRLLVAADGARSRTRELAGVEASVSDYEQVAVIANLTPELGHGGRAFERFTQDGPLALLPITGGRCALIWTVPQSQAEAVLALPDEDFLQAVQSRFGHRLGRLLKAGERSAYPLAMVNARRFVAERTVIIGNAAHSLHPVAGQGLNLAIRDVAVLAELLHAAVRSGGDPGSAALLEEYLRQRRGDYRRVAGFTDLLVRLFSNALPGLVQARNLGLLALDLFPAGKRSFLRQTMGRAGPLPRLARGLPLTMNSP